jgi:hypothetical protein
MRRAPVLVEPAAPHDAARRDAAGEHVEAVQHAAVERALDLDAARGAGASANRDVAGAIDREAPMSRQARREHVREQPLREAAAVDLQTGRARDDAAAQIDVELAPAARRTHASARGFARRRQLERARELERLTEVVLVAGRLQRLDQRCIDEAFGQASGRADRGDEPRHQRAHGHFAARVLVQPRKLAVRQEARELLMPELERVPGIECRCRC